MYLPGAHSLASSDTCKNNAREWDKVRGSRYSMRMKEKREEGRKGGWGCNKNGRSVDREPVWPSGKALGW